MLDITAIQTGPTGVRPLAPSGLSWQAIEAASWEVARGFDDVNDPPCDLEAILTETGGRVETYVDPACLTGTPEVEVHGPNDYRVRVPHYHARTRRRFLVAAGIGRYMLHSGFHTTRPESAPTAWGDPEARMHWEACAFASALLLPQPILADHLKGDNATGHGLAHVFDVTETLIANRVKALSTRQPEI